MQSKFDDCEKLGGDIAISMRNYLADVYSPDMQVERVMKKLDELGIAGNTILIFSSDQGPAPVIVGGNFEKSGKYDVIGKNTGVMPSQNMLGYAGGFRGGKHTQFEGGVRSPFIIRWPGKVPANKVNMTSVVSGIDFFPTMCSLVGIDIDAGKLGLEGEDMSDALLGKGQQRTTPLFWKTSSANANPSMLDGKWKMHRQGNSYVLYDLSVDQEELNDVADKYPEITKKMRSQMEAWNATLPKSYVK
jgi:N-acetylgalactosamine-6-sulfatase